MLAMSSVLFAQGLFENAVSDTDNSDERSSLLWSGYGRGSVFGGSRDFDFATVFGEFCLQGNIRANKLMFHTDLRFRSGLQFGNEYTRTEIKEAYAGYSGERTDILFGQQIVAWGRTDGFNPTNNITPDDYFFLSSEPDDQKLSNFMMRIRYRPFSFLDLDLIAIPYYKPSIYRYDLFNLGDNATFDEMILPDRTLRNSTLAVRTNFEFSEIGFSLSWFRGYDPYYGFDLENVDWSRGFPVIDYIPSAYLKNSLGADLAIPLGKWIVRGEMAYNLTKDFEDKIYIPNPDLTYVFGIEGTFVKVHAILQYIGKYTQDFTSLEEPMLTEPGNPLAQLAYANDMIAYESALFNRKIFLQQEKTNHAFSLTLSRSFAYEALNAEFTVYYNTVSEDYMLRPKITWKVTDALAAAVGLSYMDGPEGSLFDYTNPVMTGGFLEMKVSF